MTVLTRPTISVEKLARIADRLIQGEQPTQAELGEALREVAETLAVLMHTGEHVALLPGGCSLPECSRSPLWREDA